MPTPTVTGRASASGGTRATLLSPDHLRAARRAVGLSQVALAEASDCHKSLIGHLEVGRVSTVYRVLADAIAAAVHVPTGDLFTAGGDR
jgi:DNA-binding XRE family transcriptional regulator